MKCKFCGCTDKRACQIPMRYVPTPGVPALIDLFGEQYPLTITEPLIGSQLAEFLTPCHWSGHNICSAPQCIEKAYVEACELMEELIGVAA